MKNNNTYPVFTKNFTGRIRELRELYQFWKSDGANILLLTGVGGSGKTTLVNKFISQLVSNETSDNESLFYWSFYDEPDTTVFFSSLNQFINNNNDVKKYNAVNDIETGIAEALKTSGKLLLVLDGLEMIQNTGDSNFGTLGSRAFDRLLSQIDLGLGQVKCIITSRLRMELSYGSNYQELRLDELTHNDALKLLVASNSSLTTEKANEIIENYGRSPLLLQLAAGYFSLSNKTSYHETESFNLSSSINDALSKALSEISPEQKELLGMMAAFSEGINIVSLKDVLKYFEAKKGNKIEFGETETEHLLHQLQKLAEPGFITISQKDLYTVNPVIREFLKLSSAEEKHPVAKTELDNTEPELKDELLKSLSDIILGKKIDESHIRSLLSRLKTNTSEEARQYETILNSTLSVSNQDAQPLQPEAEPPKVFISYVREDKVTVLKLRVELEKNNIVIWQDTEELLPGDRWKVRIKEAIENGDYFLACFSKNYALKRRTYMNHELMIAIEELRLRPSDRLWFIPVLLDPVDIPKLSIGGFETLHDIQHVELFEEWDLGISKIVRSIFNRN